MRTKPPNSAIGTFPRLTSWKPGAMRAPMMERSVLSSLLLRRCTTASRRMKSWRCWRGQAGTTGHDVVRSYWQRQKPGADFEQFWQTSLNNGVVADSAFAPKPVKLNPALADRGGKNGRDERGRNRNRAAPRSLHWRWQFRQQWLVAGIAQAPHQVDLGQRRAGQSRQRPEAGRDQRRCGEVERRTGNRWKRPSGLRRATPMIPSPCTWVTDGAAPAMWARAKASTPTCFRPRKTPGSAAPRSRKRGRLTSSSPRSTTTSWARKAKSAKRRAWRRCNASWCAERRSRNSARTPK